MIDPSAVAHVVADLADVIDADRLHTDELTTFALGTDASLYRLTPQLVVRAKTEAEVVATLRAARRRGLTVTFRAAGTSLSGQAITDSLLLALSGRSWNSYRIQDGGAAIALEPGIIGAHANVYLAPYGRKIGPDPASIAAAKIGGIAANNASGMCCGTQENSYNTLLDLKLILADGTRLDTSCDESRERFRASHANLLDGLSGLAARVRADEPLAERIRRKFAIKNTMGYSLNALLDYVDPFDVLAHLMIGSEGTLAFLSEITLRTVVDHPHRATALPVFPTLRAACEAILILAHHDVAAVELMDRASLRSVTGKPGIPLHFAELGPDATALLIETRARDAEGLRASVAGLEGALRSIDTLHPAHFTSDPAESGRLWAVRKGLAASVGSARPIGTSVIIEDVAFATDVLADAVAALRAAFVRHGYADAILFGHALAGNLHFVVTQMFESAADVARYGKFIDEVARIVVGEFDGSLKAEHGTGRNMAPFVELEWGAQAYGLMKEIKQLFDPSGLLNPGVILSDDRETHLRHLKSMLPVDACIDTCIECGFCEPACPSRELSLTPRQRIAALREMARLEHVGDNEGRLASMRAAYAYAGVATCATDGLCATSCPVDIDTGSMMKRLRASEMTDLQRRAHSVAARHYGLATALARTALRGAGAARALLGDARLGAVTAGLRLAFGDRTPIWNSAFPRAGAVPSTGAPHSPARDRVVLFPGCVGRMLGTAASDEERVGLPQKVIEVLERAGYDVVLPAGVADLCCGQPWASRGLQSIADAKRSELERALLAASEGGALPIVVDTSPCTLRVRESDGGAHLSRVTDLIEFLHDDVLPRLPIEKLAGSHTLHAVCSVEKMGLSGKLRSLVAACVDEVFEPRSVTCCGWAGDRGFTRPELTASALSGLAAELPAQCHEGWSSSRTCEIGFSMHGGRPVRSVAYLVERCSRGSASPEHRRV